jgi:polysaccharide biosynthesis/export protein
MKRVIKLACLVLLGLAVTGMRAQDDSDDASAAKPAKAPVPEVQATSPGVPVDYIIGADDTLHISVWKEPDMSVSLPVRPDGKISMPLLDDVQAAGMTPMQL